MSELQHKACSSCDLTICFWSWLHHRSCAYCHIYGAWVSSLSSGQRTPGVPCRKSPVAWIWADSPPPEWHGREWSGSLAGSAFYCCCAAVPAEPSTAEYRWCLFNLAPPLSLSFNCPIPVASNKPCVLKHCTSYRYWLSLSKFMVSGYRMF